jgi:hypothetical protein
VTDWGLAFNRARDALVETGGVIQVPAAVRTATIRTQVVIPKGLPHITIRCESRATLITSDPSLVESMFHLGGSNAPGGMNVDIEGCSFVGPGRAHGSAFTLVNANGASFRQVRFDNFSTAVHSVTSYALTFRDVEFGTSAPVGTGFHSVSSAHNLVADRVKAYGGGTVFRIDAASNNVVVQNGDFEGNGGVLEMSGGSSVRFVGNYVEYQAADPVRSGAVLQGANISDNWFAFGKHDWALTNFVGGQFKRNHVHDMVVDGRATMNGIEISDNIIGGMGRVAASSYAFPTLMNSWRPQMNYSTVAYRRDSDGRVTLKGHLINHTAALRTVAFMLPPSYRPSTIRNFAVSNSSHTIGAVQINPDGAVVIMHAGGAGTTDNPLQASVDGISFDSAF